MRIAPVLWLGLVCLAYGQDAGRWRLQFFHDKEAETFAIADLKFASPTVGIAVGAIRDGKDAKPMSAITTDGGAHWSMVPLREAGRSLFFLNDSLGWMVTEKGLWRTEEGGRAWRKLKAPSGIARVHFADPDRGWAVGDRKQAFETADGGVTWTRMAFVNDVKASADFTRFTWIEFANPKVGMIGGVSRPPRRTRQRLPDWLDPQTASSRRAWPQLTILSETRDGGKTWTASTASLFGQITGLRFSTQGWALSVLEFSDVFEWPSEVMRVDWAKGTQTRVYRESNRKITDIGLGGPKGEVFLAGTEQFGKLQELPIPRKVKILRSEDQIRFTEMPVDYRATARRVMLASAGPNHWWAATDTGMILKLVP